MSDQEKCRVTRLDYCPYLLSSQINYTLTNFANHSEQFSHDMINRYLAGERIAPHLVWENVEGQIVTSVNGILVFDDMVLDKEESRKIEFTWHQWSGKCSV
jgi:hypothetical protein